MKYSYCLFDLDGTLTDPGIGITNSVMYALEITWLVVDPAILRFNKDCDHAAVIKLYH